MHRVTPAQLADHLMVNKSTVSRAIAAGRVTIDSDGLVDLAGAAAQFEQNRLRRRRRVRRVDPDVAAVSRPTEVPPPAAYRDARSRRDHAEAELAEMKAAEMRGDLVRRAVVEREIAGKLVALRDRLEGISDRVGALVAVETSATACRRIILGEIRLALLAFVEADVAIVASGDDQETPT